jgi:hypothetical protein
MIWGACASVFFQRPKTQNQNLLLFTAGVEREETTRKHTVALTKHAQSMFVHMWTVCLNILCFHFVAF